MMSNNFFLSTAQQDIAQQMELYKRYIAAQQAGAQPQRDVLAEIEQELQAMSSEARAAMMQAPEYMEAQQQVNELSGAILEQLIRPHILSSEQGVRVLDSKLNVIRTLRTRIERETNRQAELFRDYTENHSDISWQDYLTLKQHGKKD